MQLIKIGDWLWFIQDNKVQKKRLTAIVEKSGLIGEKLIKYCFHEPQFINANVILAAHMLVDKVYKTKEDLLESL